ncbi:MAG TPA: ferredoxin reductase family protein [Gaiellaceae bacterium]|nr:ferredoxin reductase family protein [Gaiellaceae bacterium]
MTEVALDRTHARAQARAWERLRRNAGGALVAVVIVGNAGVITWLWAHGDNVTKVHTTGEALTSIARITGLWSAYLALIQVVLLARLPALERVVGFDRLSRWHRWNGHVTIDLVIAHVVFSVWGYALMDKLPIPKEISTMIWGGVYPGMITATVGTGMLIGVVATSLVIVRRRLSYEWWYVVHLLAYAGIALAWFHQIPTGNELVLDHTAANYWRALYIATLVVLVFFRVLVPLGGALRHRLRVAEVVPEGPGVVSVRITGRKVDRLRAQAGQFFLWRFLDGRRWHTAHPFSLSAAPDGKSLRITVKALGDHTGRLAELRPGTRVVAEGPFGVFTERVRRREKALLIAGGIGITPVRALLETMRGDVVVVYRAIAEADVIFREELDTLAQARGATVHYVLGDHRGDGADLLSPAHLKELVPDIEERDVYLCGPPAMTEVLEHNVRGTRVPRRHIHIERFALT